MQPSLPIARETLAKLRQVRDDLEPDLSKHDQVAVMIPMCIELNITEGNLICLALKLCGYNPKHVGLTLAKGAKGMPASVRWFKANDGRYRLPN